MELRSQIVHSLLLVHPNDGEHCLLQAQKVILFVYRTDSTLGTNQAPVNNTMFHDVAARGGGVVVVRWQLWKDGGVVKNERVTNDCLHLYVPFMIDYFLSGLLEGDRADCVYPVLGRAVQVKQWDTEFDSPPCAHLKVLRGMELKNTH